MAAVRPSAKRTASSAVARLDLVYAAVAGLLVPFAFAPYELWPLAIFAISFLMLQLR